MRMIKERSSPRVTAHVACSILALIVETPVGAAETGSLSYEASFFSNAQPDTALDMVKRVPGFTFENSVAQNGAQARGYASSGGNVLIDGQRPTAKADTLNAILDRIPADDVERIEVIRGGASGVDMQGHTLIANVVRKTANATKMTVAAGTHVFLNGLAQPNTSIESTHRFGRRTYEGSVTLDSFGNDGYGARGHRDVLDSSSDLVSRDTARQKGAVNLRLTLKGAATAPLLDGHLQANITVKDVPYTDHLTYASPVRTQTFDTQRRTRTGEFGLNWKGPIGQAEVETLILQTLEQQRLSNIADDDITLQRFDSESTTGESIARATVRSRLFKNLIFESGGEGVFNFLDGNTGFVVNGVAALLPSPDVRVEERRAEIFALGTWKSSDHWALEAGFRFEASAISFHGDIDLSDSFFYPKPRVVLTWSWDQQSQLRLRYENVVGQLTFGNFIATSALSSTGITAGNGELRPDQHSQHELSYERHFWDKGALVASFMHEEIRNVVDFVPVAGPSGLFDAPGNVGKGHNQQLGLTLSLPLDGLGIAGGLLSGNATWNISQVRDPVTNEKRSISGQRPRNVRMTVSQDIARLKSTWSLTYVTCDSQEKHYYRLSEVRSSRCMQAPYLIAAWNYRPNPTWSLAFEARNIARVVFEDKRELYANPRHDSVPSTIESLRLRLVPIFGLQIRRMFN